MRINLPFNLDNPVDIIYNTGFRIVGVTIITLQHINQIPFTLSEKVNGIDAEGNRITNIVGHNGSTFLKRCPHRGCRQPIKTIDEFGESGRTTNGIRRDQSWCNDCRLKY